MRDLAIDDRPSGHQILIGRWTIPEPEALVVQTVFHDLLFCVSDPQEDLVGRFPDRSDRQAAIGARVVDIERPDSGVHAGREGQTVVGDGAVFDFQDRPGSSSMATTVVVYIQQGPAFKRDVCSVHSLSIINEDLGETTGVNADTQRGTRVLLPPTIYTRTRANANLGSA